MRILYVSQYFPPEPCAPAARVSELSRHWAETGHEVTVLTAFPHHPTGVKRPEDRGLIVREERHGPIHVVRSYVWAAPNEGTVPRILSYLSYMCSAIFVGATRLRRPDIVVATSPQLFCAVAGWVLSVLMRCPFVFEVRDLWPESVTAVGAMGDGWLVRWAKRLAAFLYRQADHIVTVGEGYRDGLVREYEVSPDRISVIPNGADVKLFQPESGDQLRAELGLSGHFVCLYLGTHGLAHALDKVLDAASLLADDPEIRFVFVGEGAEKKSLLRGAADRKLHNVQFLPAQPKHRVPEFYAAADVCLVPLRRVPLFAEVLPSKIFEIMAMERPVVLSVDGEARRLVERARSGVVVGPEDAPALASAIRRLKADPQMRHAMGLAGRCFLLRHYTRAELADRYLELLTRLVGNCKASGAATINSGHHRITV
ncbi:MAG: glycosyltransferase family 4 protein [Planctomycetes bacterium]|nr:glycosyltransferase family 4 protein [Planctomycetota bacterium]